MVTGRELSDSRIPAALQGLGSLDFALCMKLEQFFLIQIRRLRYFQQVASSE